MLKELAFSLVTYLAYILFKELGTLVHIGYTLLAFGILRFFPDKVRDLIQVTLLWHIFELIDAFVIGPKYDEEYKCTHTASVSKSEMTDDEVLEQSLNEKDSPSNSSRPQMEESIPQKVSMSNPQSTDVQ
jgi:hypothetical protein